MNEFDNYSLYLHHIEPKVLGQQNIIMRGMNNSNFFYRVFDLYYDGFRSMTLGKTLWTIIIVKLIVIFFVLKLFFFPDFLKTHAPQNGEADFVNSELQDRARQT